MGVLRTREIVVPGMERRVGTIGQGTATPIRTCARQATAILGANRPRRADAGAVPRPSIATLRRAVSSAYHALFHLLVDRERRVCFRQIR